MTKQKLKGNQMFSVKKKRQEEVEKCSKAEEGLAVKNLKMPGSLAWEHSLQFQHWEEESGGPRPQGRP